jgi:hypothetical protein
MSTGVGVVVAALAPVVISRYGITGHEIWLLCSLAVLLLDWVTIIVTQRDPTHRAAVAAEARASRVRLGYWALIAPLLEIPLQIALILVVLGPFPDLEPALYITAVAVMLFEAAWILTYSVYSQAHPAAA